MRASDIDGDGDYDILSASGGDNKISWYENTLLNEQIGDLNNDGILNILDIVLIVNHIFGGHDYNITADINQDGEINVVDIVTLVNLILN